ncbi:hypothetical protein [Brochothrix thermosphacta]|uniref:DUF1453 domain-containing protein n=1 Tax=Brochothrix thermosphacta TaxID=2756 RepID=A0A2X0QSD5_BROTH|nr:hypothetical protein [Brochothrix thermosphacta]EUJ34116.1 hypothetical protein BTHER_13429 [Brochothrix thermosphacta DSM 20171 = FSL F6-1036]SPN75500.1 conserved membrane hypothetical protein [Brochothrix thermosphacta]SPP25519.1 conserved membrane hypothetical protein [Brochothrix thermosphacta]SPP27078.1 conserved membrane hypothetical protein [Brochothrix thermosphacta]
MKIIEAAIIGTPIWVWIILLYIIKRGLDMKKDGIVKVGTTFVFPFIFIIWGLETVVTKFSNPLDAIIAYIIALIIGSYIGIVLYSAKQRFYIDEHRLIRKGSSLPLVIILMNFSVKYALNVHMNKLQIVCILVSSIRS